MINNVVLVGRLTKKPELDKTPNGVEVTKFTLAVNRRFSNGAEREADFIQCVAWRKTAEIICNYADKGHQIGVEGRIQTRTYDDANGTRRYITEVVVESITLLQGKNDAQSKGNYFGEPPAERTNENPFENAGKTIDLSDEDLPF